MAVSGNSRMTQTIGFNIDKSGLNELTRELQKIQNMSVSDAFDLTGVGKDSQQFKDFTKQLKEAQSAAQILQNTLDKSFDIDLNAVNVSKFSTELKKLNVKELYTQLSAVGSVGQQAFRNVTAGVFTTNTELTKTAKWIQDIGKSMANTVRWGITSGIWNNMTGAVSKAYSYVKRLDSSLNDIRIVTNKSSEDMERFAVNANKAAKELKSGTVAQTNASLIYYQQGLSDEEVAARTETTIKTANVTGQSASTVSGLLTSVWNGYKVSADEAEMYVDKLAAVAASTGADLNELSVGMSKVASAANVMGIDMDQLNAQLATIVTVTRQAPESVGTALKTIFARMGDIEAGLDSETTLGNYTSQMAELGFNVLDMNGHLRDQGEVIEEIGNKWGTLTREQQVALSQIMAGTRQYNNLLALFDNWGMYTEALKTSENSLGTLQQQQDIYAEKTEAHLQRLTTSTETLYSQLFDKKIVNNFADFASGALDEMSAFIDAIGGGGNALLLLGTIATDVFHGQIVSGIGDIAGKFRDFITETRRAAAEKNILEHFKDSNITDEQTNTLIDLEEKKLKYDRLLSDSDKKKLNSLIEQTNEYYKQINALEEQTKLIDTLANLQGEASIREAHGSKNLVDTRDIIKENTENAISKITENIANYEKIEEDAAKKIEEIKEITKNKEQDIIQDSNLINGSDDQKKFLDEFNNKWILQEETVNNLTKAQQEKKELEVELPKLASEIGNLNRQLQEKLPAQKWAKLDAKRTLTKDSYEEKTKRYLELKNRIPALEQTKITQESELTEIDEKIKTPSKVVEQIDEAVTETTEEVAQDTTEAFKKVNEEVIKNTSDLFEAIIQDLENNLKYVSDEARVEIQDLIENYRKNTKGRLAVPENESSKEDSNKQETARDIMSRYKELPKYIEQTKKDALAALKDYNKNLQKLSDAGVAQKLAVYNMNAKLQMTDMIDRITSATEAFGKFTVAVQSAGNFGSIVVDNQISGWDKFKSIIESAGTSIGSFVSAATKVGAVFGKDASIFDVIKTKIAASTAAREAHIKTTAQQAAINKFTDKTTRESIKTFAESAEVLGILNTETDNNVKIQKVKQVAEEMNITLEEGQAEAVLATAEMTQAQTVAEKESKVATDALNASLLKSPYTWIVAALAAVVAIATAFYQAQQKIIEQTNEANKEFTKQKLKLVEEKEALEDVAKAWEELNAQYKAGQISKIELMQASADLIQKNYDENFSILQLSGSYEELTKQMGEYAQKQREANVAVYDEAAKALTSESSFSIEGGDYFATGIDVLQRGGISSDVFENILKVISGPAGVFYGARDWFKGGQQQQASKQDEFGNITETQTWKELKDELKDTTSIWLQYGASNLDEDVGKEIAAAIPNAVTKTLGNEEGIILQFDKDVFNGDNPFESLTAQEEIYQYLNDKQKELAEDTGETSKALLKLREKLADEAETRQELIDKYKAEYIPMKVYSEQLNLAQQNQEFTYDTYKDMYDDIKGTLNVLKLTGSDLTQFQQEVVNTFGDRGYAAMQIDALISDFTKEKTEELNNAVYGALEQRQGIAQAGEEQIAEQIALSAKTGQQITIGNVEIKNGQIKNEKGEWVTASAMAVWEKESAKRAAIEETSGAEVTKEKNRLLAEDETGQYTQILDEYQDIAEQLEQEFINIGKSGFEAIASAGFDFSEETATQLDEISAGLGHDLLESRIETAKKYGEAVDQLQNTEQLSSIVDFIHKGQALSEEQNTLLKTYEEHYAALKQIADKGSEAYIRTLESVIQKEEDESKAGLEITLKGAEDELARITEELSKATGKNKDALMAEYEDQYKILFDINSQLTQAITNDALSNADSVVRKIQNLGTALKSIQDGFTVKREDLDELLDIFPELAYQAEVTSDGILHLNQEVAESILGAQADELDSAKELALFKIDQQIAELEMQIEQDTKHMELVKSGAVEEEKLIGIINEEKNGNAEQELDVTAAAQQAQMENNATLCKSIVEDWGQAQEAVYKYGEAVLDPQNRKAIAKYEVEQKTTSTADLQTKLNIETDYSYEDLQSMVLERLQNKINSEMNQLAELQKSKAGIFGAVADAQEDAAGETEDLNDLLDDQIDRYHDINVQLQLITNQIDKLAAAESKLVGNSLIKNLQEQNKLLDEQIEKELQKQEIRYGEARELKGYLKGFGVEFADDTITNYQAILKQYQDTYNSLARSGADEGYLDAAQQNYETLQEYIERYEELVLNEIPDAYNDVMNMYYDQIERGIEIENTKLNIELDAQQAIRDLNTFVEDSFNKLKYWGKDITTMLDPAKYANEAAIRLRQNQDSLYTDAGTGSLNLNAANLQTIVEEVDKALANQSSRYSIAKEDGSFVVDQQSMLQELQDSISAVTDNLDELAETAEKAHEEWQDYFDTFNDALDAIQDNYDDLDKRITHASRMSELMYGSDNYAQMSKFNRNQIEANQSRLGTLQQMQDALQTIYDNIEDKTTEEAKKTFDRIREIEDDKWSLEEDTIEKIQEQMLNAIDEVFSPLYNQGALQEWDISQQNEEGKLDATNKEVELEIFDDRIAEALQTATPKAQAALKKFQDTELKFLKEKDKLTQYDLERAQVRYELLLKQIALEDAQNNKTKMRLRRDAQGNYSYQYVADEADVDEKEQEYKKAQLDVYNKDKEYYIEQLNKPNEILEYYQEQIKDVMTRYNTAATDEEREQAQSDLSRIQDLMRQGLSDWWTEDWDTAKNYLTQSFGENWAGVSASDFLTRNKISLSDLDALGITEDISSLNAQELIDRIASTNEGAALLLDNITNSNGQLRNVVDLLSGPEGIDGAITNIFNQVQLSLNEADTQTQMVLDTTKENLGEVRDGIADIADITAVWEEQTDNLNSSMQEVLNAMTEVFQMFDTEIESMPLLDRMGELVTKATALQDTIKRVIQQAEIAQQKVGDVAANTGAIVTGSPTGGDGDGTTSISGIDLEALKYKLSFSEWIKEMSGNMNDYELHGSPGSYGLKQVLAKTLAIQNNMGKKVNEDKIKEIIGQPKVRNLDTNQKIEDALRPFYEEDLNAGFTRYFSSGVTRDVYERYLKFDTGGYTGAWGKSGKMAMLHEKELVLNAKDTENMLDAVAALRSMQTPQFSINDGIVAAIAAGLERTFASIVKTPSISSIDSSKNFQQTVTINADFPNVTSQSEIEAALRNLTSIAAQRTFTTLR